MADGIAIVVFVGLWMAGAVSLTALPVVAALRRRMWIAACAIGGALALGHVFFWLWAAPLSFKGETLFTGVVVYLLLALATPIALWRMLRVVADVRRGD